jgi:CxxC motif-containing protein
MKEITCIVCPLGCRILIQGDNILNYKCKKGLEYAKNEITSPKRVLTTTIKVIGFERRRLPVRVDREIPKDKLFLVLRKIKKIKIDKKVKSGEILIYNILNLGANVISCETIEG